MDNAASGYKPAIGMLNIKVWIEILGKKQTSFKNFNFTPIFLQS